MEDAYKAVLKSNIITQSDALKKVKQENIEILKDIWKHFDP